MEKTIKMKQERVDSLKYMIRRSKGLNPEVRKIYCALLDASDGLTRPVYFTTFSSDFTSSVDVFISLNEIEYLKNLNGMISLIGSDFRLHCHKGFFSGPGNFQDSHPSSFPHTVWLSADLYDRSASEITKEQVEAAGNFCR